MTTQREHLKGWKLLYNVVIVNRNKKIKMFFIEILEISDLF